MTAEEFYKYDQEEISYLYSSSYGVREYDPQDLNENPYSKEEMIAFAKAFAEVSDQAEELKFYKKMVEEILKILQRPGVANIIKMMQSNDIDNLIED